METLIKFEEGKTYATPSIGDSSYMVTATVVKRTAKRVTFQMKGETKTITKGIFIYEGQECFYPRGQYSFCPTLRANDVVEEKPPAAVKDDIKPSEIVLFPNGETLEDLFVEGAGVFTVEQMDGIKNALAELLMAEAFTPQRPTAKIYNLADYRR